MSDQLLTPNTNLALLQASQNKTGDAALKIKEAQKEKNLSAVDAAAKDFEAVFITEMLKPMFEGIEPNERFGGGKGEEIFNGMMLEEYGKMMAETGQIGIAKHVKAELLAIQEKAKNGS